MLGQFLNGIQFILLMHVQSGHYDIHDSKKRKIKKSGKDDQSNHHIYAAQAKGKHKCKIIIHKN